MKKIISIVFSLLLLISINQAYAAARSGNKPGAYFVQGLTGGTDTTSFKSLDSLDITGAGNPNTYDLIDNDIAFVIVQSSSIAYKYVFDADGTDAEDSPDVIRPDDYSTGGVWILVKIQTESLDLTNITLADFTDDIGATDRGSKSIVAVTMTIIDASKVDVTNGTSEIHQLWRTVDTTLITDFVDAASGGDHSEFSDGDDTWFLCNTAQQFDCSDNTNFKCHGNNDYTCAAGEMGYAKWDASNNYWVIQFSETKTQNFSDFKPPNSTDPDVDETAQISIDTDGANETGDVIGRSYDGSNQFSRWRKIKCYSRLIPTPNDFADALRDLMPIWTNNSGMTFTLTEIIGKSDIDDTSVNMEVVTATNFGSPSTVDALEIATNGTSVYYVSETSFTDATIAHDEVLCADFDDTDTPGWVDITFCGWFDADID